MAPHVFALGAYLTVSEAGPPGRGARNGRLASGPASQYAAGVLLGGASKGASSSSASALTAPPPPSVLSLPLGPPPPQELAMLEQSMVALPPSHVAAGAAALAATYFDDLPTLRALPALIPAAAPALGCMHALLELQHAAFAPRTERSPTLPVSDKFSAPGWHHAALMPPMQQLAGVAVAARHAAR
jgi:hypothetical protein